MRKSDKIICKKEISFSNIKYYSVGETATIINIWNENYYKSIFITCKIKNIHHKYEFDEFGLNQENLKTHFYSQKELRKQKLIKLNENNT